MRTLGRKERPFGLRPPTKEEMEWVESFAKLYVSKVPKGVFKYKNHEEANADWDKWMAQGRFKGSENESMPIEQPENVTKKKCTMSSEQLSFLQSKSSDYVWWKTPEVAIEFPHLVLGQVMNLCTWEDLFELENTFSKDELLFFLENAEAGQLSPRSWNFWHNRLGFKYEDIPPYPVRKF